jgi:hypothetical protein
MVSEPFFGYFVDLIKDFAERNNSETSEGQSNGVPFGLTGPIKHNYTLKKISRSK